MVSVKFPYFCECLLFLHAMNNKMMKYNVCVIFVVFSLHLPILNESIFLSHFGFAAASGFSIGFCLIKLCSTISFTGPPCPGPSAPHGTRTVRAFPMLIMLNKAKKKVTSQENIFIIFFFFCEVPVLKITKKYQEFLRREMLI